MKVKVVIGRAAADLLWASMPAGQVDQPRPKLASDEVIVEVDDDTLYAALDFSDESLDEAIIRLIHAMPPR